MVKFWLRAWPTITLLAILITTIVTGLKHADWSNKAIQFEIGRVEALEAQQTHFKLEKQVQTIDEQKSTIERLEAEKKKLESDLQAKRQKSNIGNAQPVYAAGDTVWDRLVMCEATGNWAINNGNGFYGGLQFTPSTWTGYGGGPFDWNSNAPFPYSREEQIAVAERVLAGQGWGAWPACSSKLGLR